LYIADVRETQAYRSGDPQVKALVELSGGRSVITIALCKEDKLVGAMTVYRQEVRPFSDKQIALLQNCAAQAVIAMEKRSAHHRNARGAGAADRDRRGFA